MFLYSSAAQYRDLSNERATARQDAAALAVHTKSSVEERTPQEAMSCEFVKDFYAEPGSIWCVPRDVLERTVPPEIPKSFTCLATSLELAMAAGPIQLDLAGGVFFYKVLQERPELKKLVPVAHAEVRRTAVHLQPLCVEVVDNTKNHVTLTMDQQPPRVVDLKIMCAARDFGVICRWDVEHEFATPLLPEGVRMRSAAKETWKQSYVLSNRALRCDRRGDLCMC